MSRAPFTGRIALRFRKRAAALLVLTLAACAQEPAPKEAEAPPNALPVADRTIGPDSAAGLTGPVAFTQEAIAAAAPGYDVVQVQDQVDGDPFPKFELRIGNDVVFDVLPNADRTRVHALVTQSRFAVGPEAEMMGATFGSAPAAQVLFCITPELHAVYDFTCSTSATGRFWRSYDLPADYRGERMPFEAINPDGATRATLVEMTWMAQPS